MRYGKILWLDDDNVAMREKFPYEVKLAKKE